MKESTEVIDVTPLTMKLSGFNLADLKSKVEDAKNLTVTGEGKDRKKSFDIVTTAHKDLKKIPGKIKTRTTDLRRPYLAEAAEISKVSKEILDLLAPAVEHLATERGEEEARLEVIKHRRVNAENHRKEYVLSAISNHAAEWSSLIWSAETAADLEEKTVAIETFKPELLVFEEFTADILAEKEKAINDANLRWEELTAKEAEAAEQARIAEENRVKAEALAKLEAEMNAKIEAAAADEKRRNDIQAKFSKWSDNHISMMVNGKCEDVAGYISNLSEDTPTTEGFGDRLEEAVERHSAMTEAAKARHIQLAAEVEAAEKARIQTEEFAAREKALADAEAKVKADAEAKEAADLKAEAGRIEKEWIATACEEAEEKTRLKYAEDWLEAHAHNTEFDVAVAMAASMVAEAEEKERARVEALKPCKDKIIAYIWDLNAMEEPAVTGQEAIEFMDGFESRLESFLAVELKAAEAL